MELIKYDAACSAIAAAKSVDELKGIHDASKAMAAAARIAKNRGAEADMMEIRFRAERRIGALMAMQKAAGKMAKPPGSNQHRVAEKPEAPTLSEIGIDKNLAERARKYASIKEQEFNERVEKYRDAVVREGEKAKADLLAIGKTRGTLGTGENEWYTPSEYIELARSVMGSIDLDPASSEFANRDVSATKYFTRDDDGLTQPWTGNVWLNPPYSQPTIAHFADKMVEEWSRGEVTGAIVLTHNYTDTVWFQKLASFADSICFTKGRVRFVSPSGDLASPTQGQAFFYFGNNADEFSRVFNEHGFVVRSAT
jgi:ParB family chromosome partitioning protein